MRQSLLEGFSYRSREKDSTDFQLVSCQLLLALLGSFCFALVLCLMSFGHLKSRRMQGHKHIALKKIH